MEGLGKDKFFLEKLNIALNKVNYFISGRSSEQVKAAENLSVALKEKQSSLQVILFINQIFTCFKFSSEHYQLSAHNIIFIDRVEKTS